MSQSEKPPSHVKQQQDRRLQSCSSTAEAILDAIMRQQVQEIPAQNGLPKLWVVEGVIIPKNCNGERKITAAGCLVTGALNDQLGETLQIRGGDKLANGQVSFIVEPFDVGSVDIPKAKEYITRGLKGVLSPIPDPNKGVSLVNRDPDTLWLGAYSPRAVPQVKWIMDLLKTFHDKELADPQIHHQSDGKVLMQYPAKDLRPLLLKEGVIPEASRLH